MPWMPDWPLLHSSSRSCSQRIPKSSQVSFSISRTILPQNTKGSLEGVSECMGIWVSLWATQHIKSLTPCEKLVCSSGTQKLQQVQDPNAVLNNKQQFALRDLRYFKDSHLLAPFSAPYPILQAFFLRQWCLPGAEHQRPQQRGCQSPAARSNT